MNGGHLISHIKVYLEGKCPRCQQYNRSLSHDFGEKPFAIVEKEMDEVNHILHPIACSRCKTEYQPSELVPYETLRNKKMVSFKLNYDSVLSPEESAAREEGHKKRYEIYEESKESFWDAYVAFALQDWRKIVGELNPYELAAGLEAEGIKTKSTTKNQLKKLVDQHIKTTAQKANFWRAANTYYIESHLLEIGAVGWYVEGDLKEFGRLRTRFTVLNFPIAEALESLRTKMIGKVIEPTKGDNAFLFKRITQLTDEIGRLLSKLRDRREQVDRQKVEIEDKNKVINQLRKEVKRAQEDKQIINRDPRDVQKIKELKALIDELINQDQPQELEVEREEESQTEEEHKQIVEVEQRDLSGLTIGVIGGNRAEQAQQVDECEVLTHDGQAIDTDFESLLSNSDEIVVLTRFVSHKAMWAAKAHAITFDKPIFYSKAINLDRIIDDLKKTPSIY